MTNPFAALSPNGTPPTHHVPAQPSASTEGSPLPCFVPLFPYTGNTRIDKALGEYRKNGELDLETLTQIIESGARTLARADLDASVHAMQNAKDEMMHSMALLRAELVQERENARVAVQASADGAAVALKNKLDETRRDIEKVLESTKSDTNQSVTNALDSLRKSLSIDATNLVSDIQRGAAEAFTGAAAGPTTTLVTEVQRKLDDHHERTANRLAELETRLGIAESVKAERDSMVDRSSTKGYDFEGTLQGVLSSFAGEVLTVENTGTRTGTLGSSRKGDFVFRRDGDPVLVVEAKNRTRSKVPSDMVLIEEFNEMLVNRECAAGLWICSTREQNRDQLVRRLTDTQYSVVLEEGTEQVVFAFLRFALAVSDRTRSARATRVRDFSAAREKVSEALAAADLFDTISRSVNAVNREVNNLSDKVNSTRESIERALNAAAAALNSVDDGSEDAPRIYPTVEEIEKSSVLVLEDTDIVESTSADSITAILDDANLALDDDGAGARD